MGDRRKSDKHKHASVDSGVGLPDCCEHSDTVIVSGGIMQSEIMSAHNNKHDSASPSSSTILPSSMCSTVPMTRPSSIQLSSSNNSDESDRQFLLSNNNGNDHSVSESDESENNSNDNIKGNENAHTARTTTPSSGMRGLINDSICKDGLCLYNFNLTFYGHIILDKRITQPMLPWIISEKCRGNKKTSQSIYLQISGKGAIGISESQGLILFDHKPTCISRFCRGHVQNSFGYLWRPDSDSNFKCFIFDAPDAETVQNVVTAVRDSTRDAISDSDESRNKDNELALESLRDNVATMWEVMYCGRLAVSHKRAPPSLIDDTIEKFKQHESELQKKRLSTIRKRHYSAGDNDAPDLEEHRSPVKSQSVDAKSSLKAMSMDMRPNMMSQSIDEKSDDSSSISSSDSSANIPYKVFPGKDAFYNVVKEEMRVRAGSAGSKPANITIHGSSDPSVSRMVHETGHNRTMLFQIGKTMLTLISPDQKSFMLNKKFREISFCSQGIKEPEYFGFICREASHNSSYMCYVFKCESEAVVDGIMGTLRQAFNTAMANSRLHVICETCPMHQLHKLCEQVKGQPQDKVLGILNKQLQILTEVQRDMINNKLKLLKPSSNQESIELMMTMLLGVCMEQQKTHTHIGDVSGDSPNTERKCSTEKPKEEDSRFKKAKKSLASSFENLLNRNKPRSNSDSRILENDDTSPDLTGFANTGYNSRRSSTMTEIDKQDLLKKKFKPLVDSPLLHSSSPSIDSPVFPPSTSTAANTTRSRPPPTSLAITTSPSKPKHLTICDSPVSSRRPTSMSTETERTEEYKLRMPPTAAMRPRSKTVGDLPSPGERPVVDQIFTTPPFKKPEAMKKKPLTRAMSFDTASPHSPRTPTMTPSRKASWRQAIFHRVVTPMAESKPGPGVVVEEEEVFLKRLKPPVMGILTPPRFTTKSSIRAMWRKAIREQILLIRMDRENRHLKARQDAAQEKRIKLNYEELNPCLLNATKEWERLLLMPHKTTKIDEDKINECFKEGIPRSKRGEIWVLLAEQNKLRKPALTMSLPHHESYGELLKQLTTHQHSILIDLGRTFPTHAYFINPLGRGQLSLFNILKAFSLLDKEVGYCQGLSFVAGVLLMHVDEDVAFDMLVYLMFGLGFRKQYRPDMTSLQIQMYQLERLLHDHHRRLHDHLHKHDIAPSLYAAPWFLTLFASQFPLGFVSKVFDLIYLQGFDVIFKVALLILGIHEELLLACNGFESTIEFLKNNLPTFGVVQMENVIKQAYSMDISKELHSYEVEYHIFQEEMIPTPLQQHNHAADAETLEKANRKLRRQNNHLLEQLQAAHNTVHNNEATISRLRENESTMKNEVRNLNLEREALLNTVSKLRTLVPENVLQEAGINFTAPIFQQNIKSPSYTSNTTSVPIGLAELKRLNKVKREPCIDEEDDEDDDEEEEEVATETKENSKGATSSQRSSDSSISNISSDLDSPLYNNNKR